MSFASVLSVLSVARTVAAILLVNRICSYYNYHQHTITGLQESLTIGYYQLQ